MLFSFLLGSIVATVQASSFDWNYGTLALWHSENAYCSPETYTTRNNKGILEGFVATYAINDPSHDTHGVIGYTSNQSAIYVSFRGSASIQNWIDNLDVKLTSYPACDKCEVHDGFYRTEQDVFEDVLAEVKSLRQKFPSYTVIVTGHSLGAALATLTTLDLFNNGVADVRMFSFGCPRVGNTEFAEYASSRIPDHSRVTHHKDMVVHTPMHERFTHLSHEWYQATDDVNVVQCSGYEDPNCSYQWHITSIDDHLEYLGVVMGGDGCGPILD